MIEVRDLVITFNPGSPLERKALRGISLRLGEGDFVSIIGSNGAGKSTLLGAIAGDMLPTSGRVLLGGSDVTRLPAEARSRHVARVFQDPLAGSCGNLSIAENLALAASRGQRRSFLPALRQSRLSKIRARIEELNLKLEDRLDQPMGSLSGGQRQALSLVMATLAPSSVLLLDEHTAALDPRNAEFVLGLTRDLAARFRLTVLMVTHSMRHALDIGTRTVMLHEGRILLDVAGAERAGLTIEDLLDQFRRARGEALAEDRLLTG
ncbi:ABC transporter ATP-binding protein [Pseudochelatococcus lubricantis]|uniref:ABC transporter ATP-binding protein n=1 Tax=Pseudochelatococcus lubricantis TaxID=1538102 RepID=UPI0035E9772C